MDPLAPLIVAVDLDDTLEGLVRCAQDLSRRWQRPLRVLHVIEPDPLLRLAQGDETYGALLLHDEDERELALGERVHRHLAQRLATLDLPAASIEVLDGPVARTLARRAEQLGAPLLILGAPRRRLGSVTLALARHAPCDLHLHRPAS